MHSRQARWIARVGCSGASQLGREEALALWTRGSAWLSSQEAEKGVLTPGRLADLVVLSQDFFSPRWSSAARASAARAESRVSAGASSHAHVGGCGCFVG